MNDAAEIIDAFVRMREALLREADAVPAERRTTPFVGQWNLIDVLAHLVGWDYTNINAIEELKAGTMPAFYRHYDPGWASYNRQLIDRYGSGDWQALRASIEQSQAAVVAMLRLLTPEELAREVSEPGRGRPVSLGGILHAAISDERQHLMQISAFLGSQRMGSA